MVALFSSRVSPEMTSRVSIPEMSIHVHLEKHKGGPTRATHPGTAHPSRLQVSHP